MGDYVHLRISLRSQLKAAITDPNGNAVLQVNSQLCTNDLVDGEALEYRKGEACLQNHMALY